MSTPSGKGIEALIPKRKGGGDAKKAKRRRSAQGARDEGVFLVEVSAIQASADQPRKRFDAAPLDELARSIRHHGILQPLVVEKFEEERPDGGVRVRYHLLAGERRLRAAKLVGLRRVPVVIRRASDDRTRLLVSLIENVQREDLNAIERAEAYARLQSDFRLSQAEIAEHIGKSREAVANTLRLLQLPAAAREAIREGAISEGHGRALLAAPEEDRDRLLAQLRERKRSVREAEAMAKDAARRRRAPVREASARRAADEARLQRALGAPVRILRRGKRGSISIQFSSEEEFRALLERLLRDRRSSD